MNRRDFLKSTAAVVAAVPLAANLPMQAEASGDDGSITINRLDDCPLDKPGWARRCVIIQNYDGQSIAVEPMLNGESFEENGIVYLRSYHIDGKLLFIDRRLILVANRRVDGSSHVWDIIDAMGDDVTAQPGNIALYHGALGESFHFFE